ncbi:MAG: membrane protein insertase YidC [Verrucomicrobiota bacterium]
MDRKSLIILVASFALLMLWYPLTNRLFPPLPKPTNQPPAEITLPLADNPNATTPVTPASPNQPAALTAAASSVTTPAGPEETRIIEDADARYTFTSRGGGIKRIELKEYPATVDCRKRNAPTNQLAVLNAVVPTPILTIRGAGLDAEGAFILSNTATGIRAERQLANGLHLVKEFRPSTNYLVHATVRLENRSEQAVPLPSQEWIIGAATPLTLRDESLMLGIEWYDGSSAQRITDAWFANRTLGCIPGTPRTEFLAGSSNVVWVSVQNQFFTIIAVPAQPAPAAVGRKVTLPPPTREQMASEPKAISNPHGFEAGFAYPGGVVGPNQTVERQFDIYTGPKEYNTLARLPKNMDLVMGFGGFFGFFAKALLLSMNGLHAMGLPYGVAIIVITVVIKLLFWPLTQASTRSMKRMQQLQPQMKALQEKYKDDPRKMNMKLMEFMRENKVSPLGGCLPMLLQIPVFFGFYRMLQSAIELRGARFLWACDLSQPDTLFVLPGLNFPVNPLPLVMGATMLWQARLTPPSPGMDPVQQKIMKYMPLMFMVFLYNFSAGLTLYWTVQNLLTIAQMKLTKSADSTAANRASVSPAKGSAPKRKR